MTPYTPNPLQIIMRNVTSSPTNATIAKQSWSCTYNGAGADADLRLHEHQLHAARQPGDHQRQRRGRREVTYDYKPLVFDYFMKKSTGGTGASGTYTLNETIYLKPRSQAAMLLQANNTPCPSPTF